MMGQITGRVSGALFLIATCGVFFGNAMAVPAMVQGQAENQTAAAPETAREKAPAASQEESTKAKDFSIFAQFPDAGIEPPDNRPYLAFFNTYAQNNKTRLLLDYDGIRTQGARTLINVLVGLQNVPASQLSRDDALAYWLNLRNALVVFSAVLENENDLSAGRGTPEAPGAMWTTERVEIEGISLSLHEIEQEIILANWSDPNVLYGLYQGGAGGPALFKPGFTGRTVHEVLEKLGRRFVNTSRDIEASDDTVTVPAFYEWYSKPLFNDDPEEIRRHLLHLSEGKQLKKIRETSQVDVVAFDMEIETAKDRPNQRRGPTPVAVPRSGS